MSFKPSESDDLLRLDSVYLHRGSRCFGPFSFKVKRGERIAILGPSGAGKSTLLKLMALESLPTSGQMFFHGRALSTWRLSELSRHRAVLPQSHDVAFGLQTELVIGLGRVARLHDPHLAEIIQASASVAHATHLLGQRFDTLSGGEQARIQLARVFAQLWDAHDGLILVDEPLAALDPGLQQDLMSSLDRYASERQHALIAILHDINQALQHFDRLLLIKDGRLNEDMPCSVNAVPALASLYGMPLDCLTDKQGHLVVSPVRKQRDNHSNHTQTVR